MTALDPRTIRTALELARRHGVDEVELRSGEESFVGTLARRRGSEGVPGPSASSMATGPRSAEVRSTMVGYAHPADLPVGSVVEAGAVLAVVEALGIVHDVLSPQEGTLREWRIEDGQAVEFGQILAVVEAGV